MSWRASAPRSVALICLALAIAVLAASASGAVSIPLRALPALLWGEPAPDQVLWRNVLIDIRLPRVLFAVVAGRACRVRRRHAGAVPQSAGRAGPDRHHRRRRAGRGRRHRADGRRLLDHRAGGLRRQPAGHAVRLCGGPARAGRGGPAAGRRGHHGGRLQPDRAADFHGQRRPAARPDFLEHGQPGARQLDAAGLPGPLGGAAVGLDDDAVARHERAAAGRARGPAPGLRAQAAARAPGAGQRAHHRPAGRRDRQHRLRGAGGAAPGAHDAGRQPPLAVAGQRGGRRSGPGAG